MKIALGVHRLTMARDYCDFARQIGYADVVVHLVNDYNQGPSNAGSNQSTRSNYEPWGLAGDEAATAETPQGDGKGLEPKIRGEK
jgi:hypothetical protein